MISECVFIDAYNNHLPSKYIKFIYRYFSKETHHKDIAVSRTITILLVVLFLGGFISTMVTEENSKITGVFTIIYGILLAVVSFAILIAVLANNRRITNIANELGISREEYNKLADLYLKP